MLQFLTIPKDPVYPPSMDWNFLRREGLRHIERLGSGLWTDYNTHDPGITILEVLCYALTDLGYRTHLPESELFAGPGAGVRPFYSAAEILPCRPVTATDIRKLLVDIEGVQNAWVEQTDEAGVRFFLSDPLKTNLAAEALAPYARLMDTELPAGPGPALNAALLAALAECQDERDKEADRAAFQQDLTDRVVAAIREQPALPKVLLLYAVKTYWPEMLYFLENEVDETAAGAPDRERLRELINELHLLRAHLDTEPFAYTWPKKFTPGPVDLAEAIDASRQLVDFIYGLPLLSLYLAGSLGSAAPPVEAVPENYYNLFVPQGIYRVTLKLENSRRGEAGDIIAEALRRLHRNRNLCEDFEPDIRITETIKVGIELTLDLHPGANSMAVLAAVYHAIDQYLCPPVRFYSLEERLHRFTAFTLERAALDELEADLVPAAVTDRLRAIQDKEYTGEPAFEKAVRDLLEPPAFDEYFPYLFVQARKEYNADRVYSGPLLEHGFVDDAELEAAKPRQTIYRSDLYQRIAAVEGVRQVETLELYKCDEPGPRTGNWCLSFDCRCLPELNLDCSLFSLRKGTVVVPVPTERIEDQLQQYPLPTSKVSRRELLDLSYPPAYPRYDLADYTSVQEDFPRTYKIGRTGVPSSETALRKAQAKQLQGYLLFFDQVLANYLAQLQSVKGLLAIGKGPAEPWQPLYEVPGISALLLDFKAGMKWKDFTEDKNNPYVSFLGGAAGGNAVERDLYKSQAQDHLLARFGEAFTDHTLRLFRIDQPVEAAGIGEEAGLPESIDDKQRFLDHLPLLGGHRSGTFNYYGTEDAPPAFWNTPNVEGLKRRVCAALGMDNWTRHTITCEPAFLIHVGPVRLPAGTASTRNKFEFYLKADEESPVRLLVSVAKFTSPDAAEAAGADFLNRAVNKSGYGKLNDNLIGFWPDIPPEERTAANALMLEPREQPEGIDERLKAIRDLASAHCQDDGFHLLEHILLRPRDDSFRQVLQPMTACPGRPNWLDPYSFWLSVIVPAWSDRFRTPRGFEPFREAVRREAPAQVAIRFVVLEREGMFAFEKAYHNWLEGLCQPWRTDFSRATDELVALMNGWEEGVLHYD